MAYPKGAVDFLNAQAASGKRITVFNRYNWGGYLIFYAPEIKVFIDGRMPHWVEGGGMSAMSDYAQAFILQDHPTAWENVFAKYGVNTVLIKNSNDPATSDPILEVKLLGSGWNIAYRDNVAIVLEKISARASGS